MSNLNGIVLVTATVKKHIKGGGLSEPDVNGRLPIMLNVVAGRFPNRNVLSGTVAKEAGFKKGNTYMAQFREIDADEEFGRRFRWLNMGKVKMAEVPKMSKSYGPALMIDVATGEVHEDEPEEVVETKKERKARLKAEKALHKQA